MPGATSWLACGAEWAAQGFLWEGGLDVMHWWDWPIQGRNCIIWVVVQKRLNTCGLGISEQIIKMQCEHGWLWTTISSIWSRKTPLPPPLPKKCLVQYKIKIRILALPNRSSPLVTKKSYLVYKLGLVRIFANKVLIRFCLYCSCIVKQGILYNVGIESLWHGESNLYLLPMN